MMADATVEIEREAAVTRDRMAATIDDLQARLSPRALVDSAVGSLSATGAHAVGSVQRAAMGHPLGIAAAGLAIGIALLARSKVRGATIEYGDSYAAYADYDDGYAANLAADDPPAGAARARIEALQHKAHVTVDDNPLAVVLVGIATGAVLGAVVPVSETEHRLFSDVRARLVAAADAAVTAIKAELDLSRFSIAGGTAGIAERAAQSLTTVVGAAAAELFRVP